MPSIQDRMIRAAKLDAQLYEEVEADQGAMGQARAVVILSAVAAGIGNFSQGGIGGIVVLSVAALVSWYIWAFLTYMSGTRLLAEPGTRADLGELLRTLGFASAPGLIRVLGIVPGFTEIVFTVASIWMLIAMVIAVRQALDYESTPRAVGVCVIGWLVQAIVLVLVFSMIGGAPAYRKSCLVQVSPATWTRRCESYTNGMATDLDSAGVYFLSVEEFEWRPEHDNPDEPAGKKKKSRTAESGHGSNTTDGQHDPIEPAAGFSR